MQEQTPPKPPPPPPPRRGGFVMPPGIIFDSDLGSGIDAILALGLLHSLGPKGRVIATATSHSSLEAAAFCEVLARTYSGEPATGPLRATAPVGLASEAKPLASNSKLLKTPLSLKDDSGKPIFRHSIESVLDTADPTILYRNALLSQKAGDGKIVLAGPATNLVQLLRHEGAANLIKERVGLLVAAIGSYEGGAPDPRIKADIAAAQALFTQWPTPLVAVGTELGARIPFPGDQLESAFTWAPVHPLVEAYKNYQPMPYDAPAQGLLAALYAGNTKEAWFKLSGPGSIQVDSNGQTRHTPNPSGLHQILTVDPAHREQIRTAYITTISTKPAPPRRPF